MRAYRVSENHVIGVSASVQIPKRTSPEKHKPIVKGYLKIGESPRRVALLREADLVHWHFELRRQDEERDPHAGLTVHNGKDYIVANCNRLFNNLDKAGVDGILP